MSAPRLTITARFPGPDLEKRLARQAQTHLAAHLDQRELAARDPDAPWRRSDLLWPQFPKG